jgi:hypothetical protein
MRSVGARVLLALVVALAVAVGLFYVGVALLYVALIGGGLAILLLVLLAVGGGGWAAGRLRNSGKPDPL